MLSLKVEAIKEYSSVNRIYYKMNNMYDVYVMRARLLLSS